MSGATLTKEAPPTPPDDGEGQARKKRAPKKAKAPKAPKTTALRKMGSTVSAAVDRSWVTRGATYPWDIGCKCDVCYLGKCQREAGDWRPVMPEINPEAKGVIFAENPGKTEILVGRPLFGRSGKETESGLLPLGLKRTDFSWDNAALCMPTGGDTRMMLADMARENRKRVAAGLPEYLSPFEACRPHVAEHVLARSNVLALGKYALTAVTGKGAAIRKIRGSMIDLWTHTVEDESGDMIPHRLADGGLAYVKNARVPGPGDLPLYPDECSPPNGSQRIRVVPTLHPAFVLREPSWRPVFRQDLSRFWNWINGTLQWEIPKFRLCPTLAEISNFLYGLGSSPTFAVDIETDGKEANYCNIRCIAIATPEGGIVIPFLGTQRAATRSGKIPPTPFTPINQAERMSGRRVFADWWAIEHGCHTHSGTYYTNEDARAIFHLLRAFLVDRTKVKIGHNFGYFDANVLIRELALEEEPQPLIDTILFFRGCHSELYRDLFTMGTLYTHVPDWKAASDERKIAVNPRDDLELARYANTDTTVDARCAPMLLQEAAERKQLPAIHLDHEIQAVYRDANRLGMRINEPARKVLEEGHSAEVEALLGSIRGIVGSNTFNPFSTRQLTRLMFEDWKLPVLFKTDTGEPAADDDTLREFILKKVLDGERLRLVKLIRRLRKVNKELTTYILPWRAWNDYRRLKEATPEEVAEAMDQVPGKKRKRKAPLVDDDDLTISKDWKGGLTGPDGRIHANYNVHCYDDKTEILTRRGWILFTALTKNDLVAQYQPTTGEIEFVLPTEYVRLPYKGPMVRLENESMDLLVTPKHRCLIQSEPQRTSPSRAKEVLADAFPRPGGRVSGWNTVHAGHYAGGPGLPISDSELRLLAMIQADGHLRENGSVAIGLHKERKITRCRALLEQAGVEFSEYSYPARAGKLPAHQFYLGVGKTPEGVLQLLGSKKTFGPWVFDLSRSQIDVLLSEIWHWDAAFARGTQYASTDPTNTDYVQALLALSNVRANQSVSPRSGRARPVRVIGIRRKVTNRITACATNQTVDYEGEVHCVSVPSTWVVVRRQGKVTISGNTARTGRASSSGPNFQNVQKWLRGLFIPEGGNTFVGADFDQIELRLVAALAGLDRYIQTIQKGGDPHALTAELLYGAVFLAELKASYTPQQWEDFQRTKIPTKASGKLATKQYIAMRVLAKTFIYAVIYGGSARTIYESVSSAEDEKTGELLFPDMTYGQIQDVYNNFMLGLPELPKWWQGAWDFAQANLYILEPILGRRRDFPSFERNEIPNMLIQGSAAAIMSRGLTKFRKIYGPNFALRRGIVNQCHDAAVVECGRSEAPWLKEALTEALTQNYFGMEFSAPAEQADDWAHAA